MNKIQLCLWFDNQAEETAKFYTSVFKSSKIHHVVPYGKSASEARHLWFLLRPGF